jgi:hypothetical protein
MANYNKQFNFRNGLQVDNDNLIVSPTGLVGIGTTIPTELLDVRGDVKISGILTASTLRAQKLEIDGGVGITVNDIDFETIVGGGVSIKSGIITAADSATGIVTYYGDARFLQGMPTSQWVDIDAGLGYTSIYAAGNVGVATVDPRFAFQVGGNTDTTVTGFSSGVGISSTGDVLITGVTTSGSFVGSGSSITNLDADNITSGTISNNRLPVLEDSKIPNNFEVTGIITASDFVGTGITAGIITATTKFQGTLVGIASTALGLSGTPNIKVGIATATQFKGPLTGTATTASSLTQSADVEIDQAQVGLVTVTNKLFATNGVGIGTSTISNELEIFDEDQSRICVISNSDSSRVSIGRSEITAGLSSNFGELRYGNIDGVHSYSKYEALDLLNYGSGNINYYLDAGNVGVNTGDFHWHYKTTTRLMSLTHGGNLGIGKTNPTDKLYVAGSINGTSGITIESGGADITGNLTVTSGSISCTGAGNSVTAKSLYVLDGAAGFFDADGNTLLGGSVNLNITSGISTFNQLDIGGRLLSDSESGVKISSIGSDVDNPLAPFQVGVGTAEPEETVIINEGSIGIGTTAVLPNVKLDCYVGDALFHRVGIGTTNISDKEGSMYIQGSLKVENGDAAEGGAGISVAGFCTATDGFSSDASGPVKITVAGSTLTFTVDGVGSASLTLS